MLPSPLVKSRHGGADRVSTKTKLAGELITLGQLLSRARERAGIKQQDLAARLHLPGSYLSKIENGTRRLDVIEFIRLADAMGIDATDLLRELQKDLE